MNIIYVTGESYIDHSYTIVKELKKHISLKIYFFAREKNEEIENWLAKFGAEYVKRTRFRNVFSVFKEIGFLLKLRKQKADCIWFNTMTIYQLYLVKFFLKRYIVMVHDVEIHPDSADKHGRISVKLTLKKHLKNTAVASKTQAEEFKNRFGFYPKVFQLPVIDYFKDSGAGTHEPRENNKSDLTPLTHSPKGEGEQKPKKSPVRFFFFSSIEKYKGIETLLEAARILNLKNPAYELNIYGKLKYDEEILTENINRLKNVNLFDKFIDYKTVHKIYSENDVIVLPYRQVTQCGPLLAGYAEGVPAIVSRLPGFLEYADDGKSALVFDNTAESLAEKMEFIINNPENIKTMEEYILNEIQNRFSMGNLVKSYIENLSV